MAYSNPKLDIVSCHALYFDCQIGFHDFEKVIKQRIMIDIDAFVLPIERSNKDKVGAIKMDYFDANEKVGKAIADKAFNLIETLAGDVASLLLGSFDIEAVTVKVTKQPHDMPNAREVSYTCHRIRS